MSASETTTTAIDASMEDTASSSTSSMRSPMQHRECNFSTHDEDGAAENLFPALFEWSQTGSTIGITGSFNKYVCVCVCVYFASIYVMHIVFMSELLPCFLFFVLCAAGARRFC